MEWEFTPAQLVKGEAQYDLEAFRSDLAREVAANVQSAHADEFQRVYALVYVEMLGAVLQRDIMDEVGAGTPLSEALHAVAARNEDLARTAP